MTLGSLGPKGANTRGAGGGARDQETFAPGGQENIPHLMREFIPQATFFTQLVNRGILGHYVATASLATGVYETINNFASLPPEHPTLFEYFRKDLKRPPSDTWVVAPSNGFNGTVNLTVSGVPSGASCSAPAISGGSGSSTVSCSTASTTPAATYTLTITGASGSLSHSKTVSLTVNPAIVCTTATANGVWNNTAFPSHTGSFTATFEATPSISGQSSAVGISKGAQTAFTGFANIVAFATTGIIQARNGGSYFNSSIPYSGGTRTPIRPEAAAALIASSGKRCSRSTSAARGRTTPWASSRTESRKLACSGASSRSK